MTFLYNPEFWVCLIVCLVGFSVTSYFGSRFIASLSIKWGIHIIIFTAIFAVIGYYSVNYLYEVLPGYWSIGVPGAIVLSILGIVSNASIMIEQEQNAIENKNKEKAIKKAFNVKGWASTTELRQVLRTDGYGIHVGDGYHWYEKGHLLTIGGSGRGKGVSVLLPALLSNGITKSETSIIVLDPKGENAAIAAPYYKRMGYDVHILNPLEIPEIAHLGNSRFNPLDLIVGNANPQKLCKVIASALHNRNGSQEGNFFDSKCRQYISLYLEFALHVNKGDFNTVYEWLLLSGDERAELLADMIGNETFKGRQTAKSILDRLSGENAKTEGDIFGTIEEAIFILGDNQIRESLSASDFDIRDVAKRPTAIFVCIPFQDLGEYSPWVRIFFNFLLRTLTTHYNINRKVLVMLDEFPQLGYIKEVEQSSAVLRGFNVSLWTVVQDLGQLSKLYNSSWETFVGSAVIKHWLGTGADNFTAEYLSKRMPKDLIFVQNPDGSPREIQKELLSPNEIMTFRDNIVEVMGLSAPARFRKTSYMEFSFSKDNASKNPFY